MQQWSTFGSLSSSKITFGADSIFSKKQDNYDVRETSQPLQPAAAAAEDSVQPIGQLRNLIGKLATTTFDKYQLLDQRDKLMRKCKSRTTKVTEANIFRGTCSDMCPEKERYRREVQKLLHPYEMTSDDCVNHAIAVKEYTRSSADQEEPLPHDLRPASILDKTMDYLITQIMGNEPGEEDQLPMWYDFLWSRTRAIRKDITQQMLTDKLAVSLIEKCARFHIHAAHRLCEKDIGDFDQKMNTENLRKCLLSLRHMYDDLNKKNIECENEAEFRSYDVLLNLDDSNILRQVLTFKQSVWSSAPIKLSLKLFSALQNNNYVSFFRYLRQNSATYFQTCIAHRYINQMRIEALKILARAYVGPSMSTSQLSVEDFSQLLGFERIEDAYSFVTLCGMGFNEDDNVIILNRGPWIDPDSPVPLKRSHILVEAKLDRNIGELINGAPLKQFTFIQPIISFDAEHCYTNDSVLKRFLDSYSSGEWNITTQKPAQEKQEKRELEKNKTRLREEESKGMSHMANQMLHETVSMCVRRISSLIFVSSIADNIFLKCVTDIIESLVTDLFDEAKRVKFKKDCVRQQNERFLDDLSSELFRDIVDTFVTQFVREISGEEFKHSMKSYKHDLQDLCEMLSGEISKRLIHETIQEYFLELCREIYETHVTMLLKSARDIGRKVLQSRIKRCFDYWLFLTRKRQRSRKILNDFVVPASFGVTIKPFRLKNAGFLCKLDDDNSQVTLINPVTVFTMKKSTSHESLSSTPTTTSNGNGTFTEKLNEKQGQHKRTSATTDELHSMLKKLKKSLAVERTIAVEDELYYKSALSSNISL